MAVGGLSSPVAGDLSFVAAGASQSPSTVAGSTAPQSGLGLAISAAPGEVASAGGGTGGPQSPDGASNLDAAETAESARLAALQELPVFVPYEVQPGDTASQIAERFGIATDYILWNNVDVIDDADSLRIGAMLQIPSVEGIIHSARLGDTVSALAVEYDSTSEAIVEFAANGFNGNADNLPVGALILIPGGRRILPAATNAAPGSDPAPPAAITPPAAEGWLWPATGRLTSLFGPRHPLGIDISMLVGTPLGAAASGQVVFVGGSTCCSYGYHVIIDHGDGMETLYAHMGDVYVASGQWVGAGEIIGTSGNTGYSTGPHLHFEIRKNGRYQDPLGYLP
ncbi:MAG: M23 family metallopeptidase [Dehalococcoidia bacterium]|nr:M23 family metallopeptidase [Dehalococcoidia bacterium]